jgi:hypothetical protein
MERIQKNVDKLFNGFLYLTIGSGTITVIMNALKAYQSPHREFLFKSE